MLHFVTMFHWTVYSGVWPHSVRNFLHGEPYRVWSAAYAAREIRMCRQMPSGQTYLCVCGELGDCHASGIICAPVDGDEQRGPVLFRAHGRSRAVDLLPRLGARYYIYIYIYTFQYIHIFIERGLRHTNGVGIVRETHIQIYP